MTTIKNVVSAASRAAGTLLVLMLSVLTASCQDAAGPDISEPEIWRLELEQVDDGSDNAFHQRGTINLRLRLNHSTTADPACVEASNPNATTFVASVEAIVSRLQPEMRGSAVGTWNCRGFSAEVRLDNGTVYGLVSDSLKRPGQGGRTLGFWTPMQRNRWTAGTRNGFFLFDREPSFEYPPFDTHFDVIVRNNHARGVALGLPIWTGWHYRDLINPVYHSSPFLRGDSVPAGQTRRVSWPRFEEHIFGQNPLNIGYRIIVAEGLQNLLSEDAANLEGYCFLSAQQPVEVELIVQGGLDPECGRGWAGSVDLRVSPGRLFLRPGSTDTLEIAVSPADTLIIQSSHPAVQTSWSRRSTAPFAGTLTVTAAADAPRIEHSVMLNSRDNLFAGEGRAVVPVEVYDLQPVVPETLTVTRGASVNATVRLGRNGLAAVDVRLSVPSWSGFITNEAPAFAPEVTRADSTTLTLRISNNALLGTHTLDFCAIITRDPRARCHVGRVTVRIVEAVACAAQLQAWYPLNGTGNDASGRGNHGTVQGAQPVNNRHGDAAAALAFDGVDDAIELGNAFNTLALPFSIAAWVYQPAAARGDLRAIFVTDDEPGRYAGIWWQIEQSGASSITFADGGPVGGATRRTLTANTPIPTDTWVHLAVTVRGPTDMTLYMNGAAVTGTYSGTGGPLLHTSAPARIGNMSILPANRPWLGRLDELRVYDCSLQPHEVLGLFDRR